MKMSKEQLNRIVTTYGDVETWLASDEFLSLEESEETFDNSIDLGNTPTPEEFFADWGFPQPAQND